MTKKSKVMKTVRYQWKAGSRAKAKPDEATVVFDSIANENDGVVSPSNVVKKSKPKKALLHKCFEWDNSTAATAYREDQARYLIRSLEVVYTQTEEGSDEETVIRVRAYHSIPDTPKAYVSLSLVSQDDELYDMVLAAAYDELAVFREKYKHLKLLREVVDAIETVLSTR